MIKKWFLEHPRSVNESYLEHFKMAFGFSAKLFKAAIACFIHAVVPGMCIKTGSLLITELHDDMVKFRVKKTCDGQSVKDHCDTIEYMI